jgi:hypothetical protein
MQVLEQLRVPKNGSKIRLAYTDGYVRPYEDYVLPEILQIPLKVHPQGFLEGRSSNKRSALYKADGKLFKQKGARPCQKAHIYSEPYGGMSAKKAKNELAINKLIGKLYGEHGFKPALVPAADVEFDMPFGNENIHANIHECNGDKRLDEIIAAIEKRIITNPSKIDPYNLRDICHGLYSWYGFANRVIDDNHITTHFDSNEPSNFVVYETGKGYGIVRIDHGSSKVTEGDRAKRERSFSNALNAIPMCMVLTDISLETGMPLKSLGRKHEMEIKYVDKAYERIDASKPIVYISRERFKLLDKANDIFFDFYDKNKTPKPIKRELLQSFFI